VLVVMGEQDYAADCGMQEPPAIVFAERGAGRIDDRGAQRQLQAAHSRITVAVANDFSSDSETWAAPTPRSFMSADNASDYCSTRLPDFRLPIQTPCQFAGAWMPVPSAFVKASLAAKRLAR